MNKLFLDCGSNIGQGYEYFSEIYGNDWEYHLFEPNPNCYNELVKKYNHKDNIKIFNNPVYINSDKVTFKFLGDFDVGGSIVNDHNSNHIRTDIPYIEIEFNTINIIDYINYNHNNYEKIILKLDVESAEYDIMSMLINTNTIYKLHKIYCEFHSQYMEPNIREKYLNKEFFIINYVKENNINFDYEHKPILL